MFIGVKYAILNTHLLKHLMCSLKQINIKHSLDIFQKVRIWNQFKKKYNGGIRLKKNWLKPTVCLLT